MLVWKVIRDLLRVNVNVSRLADEVEIRQLSSKQR